jgi:hypothetical protein
MLPTFELRADQLSERDAANLVAMLSNELDGLDVAATERNRLALSALYAALDHHAGLVLLFCVELYAPGFALLRPAYEGFVRGTWLRYCASEKQVRDFSRGRALPSILELLSDIERTGPFAGERILSSAHSRNWQTLCGFAHNGIQQSILHLQADEIARTCPRPKIDEALSFAGAIATLARLIVCTIADAHEAASRISSMAQGAALKSPA